MKVQLDTDSAINTLNKITDPIVRVKIMRTIMDAVDRLNKGSDTLFRGVMDELQAPKDLKPKAIEGYERAVATLHFSEASELPVEDFINVILSSKNSGIQGKGFAISSRFRTFEMGISDAFDKFANNFLKQSELFQRRMVEVRKAAEDEYAKLLGRK